MPRTLRNLQSRFRLSLTKRSRSSLTDTHLPTSEDWGVLLNKKNSASLSETTVHVKLKLSALWASTMFLYIYGDLFGFFRKQTVAEIVSGHAGFIGTQAGLLAASSSVAIPSIMVFISLVLRPRPNRALNVILGIAYTIIILSGMPGAWLFYIFFGVIEATLTALIVWYAWHWPSEESQP